VSDSHYAYTRCYRDNRVFVVINKGGKPVSISGKPSCRMAGHTSLPAHRPPDPRERWCVRQFSLAAKEACVIAVQGSPLQATTVVKFQINNYTTHPGEGMAACGGDPELEYWDVGRCPRLEFINGDAWFAEVGFNESAGKAIRFKFVVLRGDGQEPVYENLVCRTFLLPNSGSVKLDLDWDLL